MHRILTTALLLSSSAVALAGDTDSVRDVTWIQPFELRAPAPYTMRGDQPTLHEGVLIELRIDPDLAVPTQAAAPVLYVGDMPATRVNWDHVGGCAVVFVPGRPDLRTTAVYFGDAELPERIDASRGAAAHSEAQAAGLLLSATRVAAAEVGGQPAVFADLSELHAVAQRRAQACSASPNDQLR
jgi:hypothetical protein